MTLQSAKATSSRPDQDDAERRKRAAEEQNQEPQGAEKAEVSDQDSITAWSAAALRGLW